MTPSRVKAVFHRAKRDGKKPNKTPQSSLPTSLATFVETGTPIAKMPSAVSRRAHHGVSSMTIGAHSTSEDEPVTRIASAPLVGFARVARGEHPDFGWTMIDLDPAGDANELDDLLAELSIPDGETEIAYRGGFGKICCM